MVLGSFYPDQAAYFDAQVSRHTNGEGGEWAGAEHPTHSMASATPYLGMFWPTLEKLTLFQQAQSAARHRVLPSRTDSQISLAVPRPRVKTMMRPSREMLG